MMSWAIGSDFANAAAPSCCATIWNLSLAAPRPARNPWTRSMQLWFSGKSRMAILPPLGLRFTICSPVELAGHIVVCGHDRLDQAHVVRHHRGVDVDDRNPRVLQRLKPRVNAAGIHRNEEHAG